MIGEKPFGKSRGELVRMFRIVRVRRPVVVPGVYGLRPRWGGGDQAGHSVGSHHGGLERGRARHTGSLGLMAVLSVNNFFFFSKLK